MAGGKNPKEDVTLLQRLAQIELDKLETLKEQKIVLTDSYAIREKESKLINNIISYEQQILNKVEKLNETRELWKEIATDTNATAQERIEIEEKLLKLSEEVGHFTEEELNNHRKSIELGKQRLQQLSKQQSLVDNIEANTKNLVALTLGVSDNWKQGTIGILAQAHEAKNLGEVVAKMGETLQKTLTPSNVLGSTWEKMKEASIALGYAMDEGQAAFTQQTGLLRENILETQELALQNRFLGVNMQNTTEAMVALNRSFSNYDKLSTQAQESTAMHIAKLTNLGVSAETSAKLYGDLNKIYDMGTESTEKLTRQLVALAGPGLTASEAVEGFEQSLSILSRYTGPKAIQVYKELASQAKAFQISTQQLLAIAGQFDTFETAATSVGKLNALLGGDYLNSVEMLGASEAERIKMLNESIHMSGKQWDTMNKFERMAIANAAGISDMTEANKLFGTSMLDVQRQMLKDKSKEKTIEEFNQLIRDTQTLKEDFISLAQSFAVSLQPMIPHIRALITWIGSLDAETRAWGVGIGIVASGGLAAGAGLLKLLTVVKSFKTAGNIANLTKDIGGLTNAVKGLAGAGGAGGAAGNVAKGAAGAAGSSGLLGVMGVILSAGAGAMMFGAGMEMAGRGAKMFFESASLLSEDQFDGIAKLLLTLPVLGATAPLLGAVALALTALGPALALFGAGLSVTTRGLDPITDLMKEINAIESEKVVQFGLVNRHITETVQKLEDKPNAAKILESYSKVSAPASATAGASQNGSYEIVVKLEDQFGNKRTLETLILDTVNGALNIRRNP